MKRRRILAVGIIMMFLVAGCSSYETKTYVLEDKTGEVETYTSSNSFEKIYDYSYNITTYGNEELAKSKSAFWNPIIDNRIMINEYNIGDNKNYINKLDYETGISDTSEGKKWPVSDTPLGLSPNGLYMVFERKLLNNHYLMIYDYQKDDEKVVTWYNIKDIPASMFDIAFCWADKGRKLVYGWKNKGESKHVVALSEDYYYNNWRNGKESIYSLYCYDVAERKNTKIYEFTEWERNDKVYNYSLQANERGHVLIFSPDEFNLYVANIYKPSDHKVINKAYSYLDRYWLGYLGIYVQDNNHTICLNNTNDNKWERVGIGELDEVDHLVTTNNGEMLYYSVRQKSQTGTQQAEKKTWDIFRVNNDSYYPERIFQGAEDLIGLELSADEKYLMLEMRDNSYQSRLSDSLLTRILIFKS